MCFFILEKIQQLFIFSEFAFLNPLQPSFFLSAYTVITNHNISSYCITTAYYASYKDLGHD